MLRGCAMIDGFYPFDLFHAILVWMMVLFSLLGVYFVQTISLLFKRKRPCLIFGSGNFYFQRCVSVEIQETLFSFGRELQE